MTKLEVTNKLNTKFKKVDFICPEDISFQIEKANYVNATVEDNDWQEIKDCNSRKRYYGTYKIEKNILTLIGTEYEIVSFTEKKLVLKASLDVYAPIGLAEFTHVLKTYKLIEKRN
ncbi:lipocalin family protein [Myroides marinus]|uniref:lipocalin family protein n=1 Tax=Myroides marinus TaxID=703342 RepID=UPI0025785AF5|nr:lipocalin family protein [Myroides marinus]MDM1345794.1 lipocalin family protein [Myroides marinus]MDM1349345.1 lipocalin family protein [Myroides marinus]MDM1352977.1 lipocalin family protein [Myroides marinus]MDM1356555.1 lipocalin family protein [Myroides marinus]MDM1360915.1 lipocalin family protein [Myroides marinus]